MLWHKLVLVGRFQLLVDKDPGLVGNLLVERLVGAHIDLVSKEEYGKIGSVVSSSPYFIMLSSFFVAISSQYHCSTEVLLLVIHA